VRPELAHMKRLPSEYLREHVYLSTQPIEEPIDPAYLAQIMRMADAEHRVLFASDYPHWDFDAPDTALPIRLPEEQERAIMSETARAFYKLD